MKHFLPILFLALSLVQSKHASAQFVVNLITVDCSSPNTCDGYAMIDSANTPNFTSVLWYMNGTLLQNGGNAIFNLCPGNYTVSATGFGVTLTSPFTIGSGTINPCAGFGVSLSSIPTSSQNACDGSITASVYGGAAPYTYTWNNGGSASTASINNLCTGTYALTVTDANGCSSTENGTVFYDTSTVNPCPGFTPVVTVTELSAPGACDGAIDISCPTCAPFIVLWSQGSTTYTINNLCEGNYAAVVTDSNGCTFNTTQFVGYNGGGNIDSINVIGNLSTGANITGTLISNWIYNCDIEMSMLDTAYMVSATFGNNPSNQDSLYTIWYLADTTGAYTYINYAFYAPFATGTYNLVLQVYCPIKSTPFYYNIITQFDVQSAGIASAATVALTLSPNPVQDILSIQGINSGKYKIFNAAGQCIQSSHFNNQIEVSQLTNGSYFLHIDAEVLPFIKLHQ